MSDQSSALSPRERAYLTSQELGRLATVGEDGSPHVVPVGFELQPDGAIDIGGPKLRTSLKYRNVERGARAALVVDDKTPDDDPDFRPGIGRGVEVRGPAEALVGERPPAIGPPGFFSDEVIRIHPEHVVSWHIDPDRPTLRVLRGPAGRQ